MFTDYKNKIINIQPEPYIIYTSAEGIRLWEEAFEEQFKKYNNMDTQTQKFGIATITKGKDWLFRTRYRFSLKGDNGEHLDNGSEAYTQKHNVVEVLEKYFSTFQIVDETGERGSKY